MDTKELKQFAEDTAKGFTDLRAEFKAGTLDPEKKERINKFLDEQEAKQNEYFADKKAQEERVEKAETKLAELEASIAAGGANSESKEDEAKKAEMKAYSLYLAKGEKADPEEIKRLTSDNTSGGYLIREDYYPIISEKVKEINPVRQVAKIMPINSKSVEIQVQTGDVGAGWVAEGAARTESTNPTFRRVEIRGHELHSEVYLTNEFVEDNMVDYGGVNNAFVDWLHNEHGTQFGRDESIAFVSGNGTTRPRGFADRTGDTTNNIATTTELTTATSGTGARKLTTKLLADALHALTPTYMRASTFAFNNSTLRDIRLLEDGDGRFVFQPGMMGTTPVPNSIFGRGYIVCVDMDSFEDGASKFPLVVGDFQEGYVIADRLSISYLTDMFTQQSNGSIKFLARRRVGGSIIRPDAFRIISTGS